MYRLIVLGALLLALAGCTAPKQQAGSIPSTGAASPQNSTLVAQVATSCKLLNSSILANILETGQLESQPLKEREVQQPVFSSQTAPATEVNCLFNDYQNSGKSGAELMQVTYWIDIPAAGTSSAAWQRAFSSASQAGQAVSGIGEQAFLSPNGRITFMQGGLYFTLEVVDLSRSADERSQIARELAGDMLKQMAGLQVPN